ncbi:MAG: methyltransferase domain-containing protein [Gammaproteobacteria bacterium]|nr:methyltransferase domain-containing protein [Gammaproteobacteria bacterium]
MASVSLKKFTNQPIDALRRFVRFARGLLTASRQHAVGYSHANGAFDALSVERAGFIQVEGWDKHDRLQDIALPQCFVDGRVLPVLEAFRSFRPDVATAIGADNSFLGLVVLYAIPRDRCGVLHRVKLVHNDTTVFDINDAFQTETPPYGKLLDTQDVLHRENIYAYGPPATAVAEEIRRLAMALPGPVLDFGCGSGVLIKSLRDHQIEAYGIELDRKPVAESLLRGAREHIQLYDGGYPLPFADGQFASVIASEVIEHVAEYETALNEIARVTRDSFLITVPDMSSIPVCHHNHVVPWHLLESTHVNFFTQASLRRVLEARFRDVQFARLCPAMTNGSKWYGNLAAVCRK